MSAAAGMGMQIAGGLVTAAGSAHEGEAIANAAEYNAQVADHNAYLSRTAAAEDERKARVMARKQLGDMRASYGASGVTLEGSALDVLEESAAAAELDALTIRHGGEVKANMFINEAVTERFKGKIAKEQGYLKATAGLLNTGGKAAAAGGGAS